VSYLLFLDDQRQPSQKFPASEDTDWVIVRSHAEFIAAIEAYGAPSVVSFDHDLCAEHYEDGYKGLPPRYEAYTTPTGLESAKFLVAYCKTNGQKMPRYYVHSHNAWGRLNIHTVLAEGPR